MKMNQNVIRFHFFSFFPSSAENKTRTRWWDLNIWHALSSSHRHFLSFLQCVTRHTRINNEIIRVFFFFLHCSPHQKKKTIEPTVIFFPQLNSSLKIKEFHFNHKKKRICNGSLSFLTWKKKHKISMLRPKKGICGQLFFFLFSVVVCNSPMVHMLSQLWILFSLFRYFFFTLLRWNLVETQSTGAICPPNSHSNWKFN